MDCSNHSRPDAQKAGQTPQAPASAAAAPEHAFTSALEEALSLMQRHGCSVTYDGQSIGLAFDPSWFSQYCHVTPARRFGDYAITGYREVGVGGYDRFELFSCGSRNACLALLCAMMLNHMRLRRMITAGEEDDVQIIRRLQVCEPLVRSIPEPQQSDSLVTGYDRLIGR